MCESNSTHHSPPDFVWKAAIEAVCRCLKDCQGEAGANQRYPAGICLGLVTNGMGQARRIALKTLSCISEEGNTQVCGFLILQIQICLTSLHDFQIELIAVDCHIYLRNSVC